MLGRFVFFVGCCLLGAQAIPDGVDLITQYGYPAEKHSVTTEDGYITVVHRIPHGINNSTVGPPVLVQHGLGSSSADFINAGPGKALAFVLADAGYDVWLANARGNSYSTSHVSLDPVADAQAFYNFSWHEVGSLDVPAQIDYILNKTKREDLYYIGYSQGGTAFYVMGSERPEYNQKVRLASLLAPSAMLEYTDILLRLISEFIYELEDLANSLHIYNLPFPELIREILYNFCSTPEYEYVCTLAYEVINAYPDPKEINATLITTILKTTPSGLPLKSLFHYGQIIKEGPFQQYNYRTEGNLLKYGTNSPPLYNLTSVTAPVGLYYGKNDLFIHVEDINTVASMLPNVVNNYLVKWKWWSHIDVVYAIDAKSLLYDEVIRVMGEY